jgi:hypothetical protein
MRRRLSAIVFCLFLVLAFDTFLSDAHAAFNVYPVAANGSTAEQNTFTYDQTPWLYVDVPDFAGYPGIYPKLTVSAGWMYQSEPYTIGVMGFNQEFYPNGFQDTWIQPDNWATIKGVGTWDISSNYTVYTLNGWSVNVIATGTDSSSFEVTPIPEPASLLLLGSGLIGLIGTFSRKIKR